MNMRKTYLGIAITIVILIILILCTYIMNVEVSAFVMLLIATAFIFIYASIKYYEINNPVYLFIIGFMIPLTMSQIQFSLFQSPFSTDTWIIIIFSVISFLMPCFMTAHRNQKTYKCNVDRLYKPLMAVSLTTIVAIIINWVSIGGIPLIAGDRNASHLDSAKAMNYLVYMTPVLAGLSLFYLLLGGKKYKKFFVFILVLPYVYSTLQMLRSLMLYTIYYQVSFFYLALRIKGFNTSKALAKIRVPAAMMIIILMLVMPVLGNFRISTMYEGNDESEDFWIENIGFKSQNQVFAWTYGYYAMGFNNLNVCIKNYKGPSLYGYNTLLPVIGPTQIKNIWPNNPQRVKDLLPRLWNGAAGTVLRDLYLDGGIIYTIIIIFLFSIIVNYFYWKGTSGGMDVKFFSVYIVLGFGVMYMFFNGGAIFNPSTVLNCILVYYSCKYIKMERYEQEVDVNIKR